MYAIYGRFMNTKERILHTLLFEIGCILIGLVTLQFFGAHDISTSLPLTIALSCMAAGWSFIYNILFDKIATGPRVERSPITRSLHAIGMEGGLLLGTVPLIAYSLGLSWWDAFIADISITLIILGYTYVYNYIYDRVRLLFVKA